jgi:hypothetical protein
MKWVELGFGETESTIHAGRALASPVGGLRTRNARWHRIVVMGLREAANGRGEPFVKARRESKRRGKGKIKPHGVD